MMGYRNVRMVVISIAMIIISFCDPQLLRPQERIKAQPNAPFQPPQQGVFDIAWSPDEEIIVVATHAGIAIYDEQLVLITMLHEHSGRVFAVTWNPNGQQFASAGEDGQLIIWQRNLTSSDFTVLTKKQGTTAWADKRKITWQTAVVWSPDGTKIASFGADQTSRGFVATIHIWDGSTFDLLRTVTTRLFFNPKRV